MFGIGGRAILSGTGCQQGPLQHNILWNIGLADVFAPPSEAGELASGPISLDGSGSGVPGQQATKLLQPVRPLGNAPARFGGAPKRTWSPCGPSQAVTSDTERGGRVHGFSWPGPCGTPPTRGRERPVLAPHVSEPTRGVYPYRGQRLCEARDPPR